MKMPGLFNLSKVMSQLGDIKTTMKQELAGIRKNIERLENEREDLFRRPLSKEDVLKLVISNIDRCHNEAVNQARGITARLGRDSASGDRSGVRVDSFYHSLSSGNGNSYYIGAALGSRCFDSPLNFAFLFAHEKLKEVASEVINGLPDDEWEPKSSLSAEDAVERISAINAELEGLNQRADELLTEATKAGFSID